MKRLAVLIFVIAILFPSLGKSAESTPPELQGIGIEEKLGTLVHLDAKFKDEQGQEVTLGKYFQKDKPVIVTLIYFECPNLCGLLLNGFLDSLKEFSWTVGKQFEVVTISIDPKEKPELAQQKKENILKVYGREGAGDAWHFLTGEEKEIQQVAKDLGFGYRYDEEQQQYAHAAGIFVLTPQGKLSRTLYGIQFGTRDLKLSLLEASAGKVGTITDRLLMYCYHYDPQGKKYALMATRMMKAGGALTVLVLLVFFYFSFRKKS